jgi:Caudovirus prohead serine protease
MNQESNPPLPTPPASAPPALTEFGPRLVELCDGRPGLRAGLQFQAQLPPAPAGASNPAPAIIDVIASTDRLDRYEETIAPGGWRLDNYRRNPVFQNAHQYGDILFTLGKALVTEVRELAGADGRPRPALFQRIEFAVEVNPLARVAYGLYQGRFLNAVSVGFIPLRWENGGPEAGYRRRYLEQELLEVSAVGIPANPEALQLGLKAGAVAKADLVELWELLRGLVNPAQKNLGSNTAGVGTDTSALGAGANGAQLLRLARALRQLLGRS